MARAINTLNVHIPDLGPPKSFRSSASRVSEITSMPTIQQEQQQQPQVTQQRKAKSKARPVRQPTQPPQLSGIDFLSPSHIAMLLSGIAIAQLHAVLIVFCLLTVMIIALVRAFDSSEPHTSEHQTLESRSHEHQTSPKRRESPKHTSYQGPRSAIKQHSVDESFAFRPYG